MGLGARAYKTKTIAKKTKKTKKVTKSMKAKAQREKDLSEMIEKEYAERMALPACEDRRWGGPSREEVERKLEENYGEWRNMQGSKHCRYCFGYGASMLEEHCEGCTYNGQVRKYLGNDVYERQDD